MWNDLRLLLSMLHPFQLKKHLQYKFSLLSQQTLHCSVSLYCLRHVNLVIFLLLLFFFLLLYTITIISINKHAF